MGRLGQDPIVRETKSGTRVVQLSVATTHRSKAFESTLKDSVTLDSDVDTLEEESNSLESERTQPESNSGQGAREYSESTQWHRIVVWGKLAENCSNYLKKGSPLFVEGSIRSRPWVDDQKVKRTSFEVHATNISFLPSVKRSSETANQALN